jgi:hypothetical protein
VVRGSGLFRHVVSLPHRMPADARGNGRAAGCRLRLWQ